MGSSLVQHHEADYTLFRLKSNSAFVICCTDRPVSLTCKLINPCLWVHMALLYLQMCLSHWSGEQPALELSAMDETGLGVSPQVCS